MWGVFSASGRLLGGFDRYCDAVAAFRRWEQTTAILPATWGLIL